MNSRADIAEVADGTMRLHLHEGQRRAWRTRKRFILVLAGTQGGKTSFGPFWLYKEIQACGPGDYLIAAPTYPLLELKLKPEFLRCFEQTLNLGAYRGSPSRSFTFSPEGEERAFGRTQATPTRVLFGHAQDPDSLESMTAKAAWLDEAGQKKFRLGSWEATQRRLSIHQGRCLVTTTPYTLGWLKNELHDPGKKGDPDVELIQFESVMNPAFPRAEFERMRDKLPRWKFNMMYRGLFERPAGMIYDCWNPHVHRVPRFAIPDAWPRFLGLDFGGVNTAGVLLAQEPGTGEYYAYRTYKAGSRTTREHRDALLKDEPGLPTAAGGAWSEDNWRGEFAASGLPVRRPPVKDVEVRIDRVYGLLKANRLFVLEDQTDLVDELESYSRELDDNDAPTGKIEDEETYHRLDALRYIASFLEHNVRNDTEVILL